jgi:uncharacterized protein
MILVADSSPLIALAACKGLKFLPRFFTEICVPQSVAGEVCVEGKPFCDILRQFLIPYIHEFDSTTLLITDFSLGRGEIEAMALYKQLHANFLLMDDRRARTIAKANTIKVVGSLGILLLAKEHNLLAEITPYVVAIKQAGIFISPALLQEALRLAGE